MACGPSEDGQMTRKRHKPEEIVAKLRQVDVLVSHRTGGGRRDPGDRGHGGGLRDELLDGEIFSHSGRRR
jgi:hypothetical protein